ERPLHPRLRPFEPRAVLSRSEHECASCAKPIREAVHQGLLGPDDEEVRVDFLRRTRRRTGDARIPRRDDDSISRATEHISEGVLSPAAPYDTDPHELRPRSG